jgi:hypothetical protein
MPIIVHKVSLGNAKTPATLKAIDDTTEPDRAPQEPGNAEEIDESYCLVWSAGLPLTGVGVGGGAVFYGMMRFFVAFRFEGVWWLRGVLLFGAIIA